MSAREQTAVLHFTECGAGQPPLVLVHGFPLDGEIFAAQRDALGARSRRVLVPDLPGFGRSPPLAEGKPYTIASLANVLYEALHARGALPCVLGGLSMGGYVALSFARQHPEALRGLVLIDTRAEADSIEGRQTRAAMIEAVRVRGAAAAADQMLPRLIAESTAHARPEVAKGVRQMIERQPATTIIRAIEAIRDREDATPWLSRIRTPTLIVVGQHDVITPPSLAEAMRAALPTAWMTTIADCGHLPPVERPEALTDRLARFLDQVSPVR